MQGTAWVAGATGYTGRRLVEALRARDIPVVAHVRPDSPERDAWQARFTALGAQVDFSPWEQGALQEALRTHAPRLVFALLGTTRARGRALAARGADPTTASYRQVDYGLSAMLLRATQAAAPDARFLYLSAFGVAPNAGATGDSYVGARARLEAELSQSGLDYVVVRPAFLSGPDREESRPLERAATRVSDALLDAAGALGAKSLRDRLHSLTGTQLARALVSLALDPTTRGLSVTPRELRARSV